MNGAITIPGPFKSFLKHDRVSGIRPLSLDPMKPRDAFGSNDWKHTSAEIVPPRRSLYSCVYMRCTLAAPKGGKFRPIKAMREEFATRPTPGVFSVLIRPLISRFEALRPPGRVRKSS